VADAEQAARVVVYRTRACPYCIAADDLLRQRGIDFDEIYLDDHPDRGALTSSILTGHRTVPLVVIDGQPIGGFRELSAMQESGGLDRISTG
jgi:glutaredoxin 3